jgi:hypothetical protein
MKVRLFGRHLHLHTIVCRVDEQRHQIIIIIILKRHQIKQPTLPAQDNYACMHAIKKMHARISRDKI